MDARATLLAADHVGPHTDADGLPAGAPALPPRGGSADAAVLLSRALRAGGERADAAVWLWGGAPPFGPHPPLPAGSVAVLDWGVRPLARRGIIVDHHVPETPQAGDGVVVVVVSGHESGPEVSTAV